MPEAITGLWAAATTLTDTADTLDHVALARHAQRLLNGGGGLHLFGSYGEVPSFSLAERLTVTEAVLGADIAAAHATDAACIAAILGKLEYQA